MMQRHFKGEAKEPILEDMEALTGDDELHKALTSILPAFREWQIPNDWTVMAVEQAIYAPLGNGHYVIGTPDTIVQWNGYTWHVQHKTIAGNRPLSSFAQEMERDWHECIYQHMIEQVYGPWLDKAPYGGTILNTVRKLSATAMKEDPKRALAIQYIPRPDHVVEKAVRDVRRMAAEISRDYANPTAVVQNRSSCMGRFGNSPCAYTGVCNGQASLYDDALYSSVVDRYQDQGPTSGPGGEATQVDG